LSTSYCLGQKMFRKTFVWGHDCELADSDWCLIYVHEGREWENWEQRAFCCISPCCQLFGTIRKHHERADGKRKRREAPDEPHLTRAHRFTLRLDNPRPCSMGLNHPLINIRVEQATGIRFLNIGSRQMAWLNHDLFLDLGNWSMYSGTQD
jgi:hypothetical protein